MFSSTSKTPGEFDDRPISRFKAALRALAAFVVFPNLLFYVIGLFLFTHRRAINIDYALLGAAWLWIPLWARVGLFAMFFVLDGIVSTAPMYNISPLAGMFAVLKAPAGLIITVIIGLTIAIIVAVAVGFFAVRFLRDRRRRDLIFLVMVGVIAVSLIARIAASATFTFASELRDRVRSASVETYPVRGATDALRADADAHDVRAQNVLLVVVESMGELRDSAMRAEVWDTIVSASIQHHYIIHRGEVAFRGGTTSGELRELCGIFTDYITLPMSELPHCLPRLLHEQGFESFAVHGYKPDYYNRASWYPKLFDHVEFIDDLAPLAGSRRCGTQFRGICDKDSFKRVTQLLKGGPHRLVYWMTIDAHTPVDMPRRHEFPAGPCSATPEVCLQALFWRDMFGRIAALALDPTLPPTRIIVVGDHAPAYVRRSRAGAFLPGRVPFIELRPRIQDD